MDGIWARSALALAQTWPMRALQCSPGNFQAKSVLVPPTASAPPGAAHPLASSFIKKKARRFADMQNDRPDPFEPSTGMPKVLFTIELGPGCLQGNYLEKAGQVKGEKEFLFSAYSAFQVVSAKRVPEDLGTSGPTFKITLKACRDNKHVSDDVPTAPWH